MDPVEGAPRCANQIHVEVERGEPEPSLICSCAAGLIHMHDCPVLMGADCLHYRQGEPDTVTPVAEEETHARLMQDYLTRVYYHRIRALAPAGDPWLRRREELYAFYSTVELEGAPGEATDDEDDRYEQDRDRLIAQRRKREEARKEREERTREDKARDRARLGIKTVVEKAQEAVASQGNIASSVVDDLKLPAGAAKKRRRRRRRKGPPGTEAGPPEAAPPAAQPKDAAEKPRRRRRRRRRKRGGKDPSA